MTRAAELAHAVETDHAASEVWVRGGDAQERSLTRDARLSVKWSDAKSETLS